MTSPNLRTRAQTSLKLPSLAGIYDSILGQRQTGLIRVHYYESLFLGTDIVDLQFGVTDRHILFALRLLQKSALPKPSKNEKLHGTSLDYDGHHMLLVNVEHDRKGVPRGISWARDTWVTIVRWQIGINRSNNGIDAKWAKWRSQKSKEVKR